MPAEGPGHNWGRWLERGFEARYKESQIQRKFVANDAWIVKSVAIRLLRRFYQHRSIMASTASTHRFGEGFAGGG